MEIIDNHVYAVLTGDLIKSSKYSLEKKQAAFQTLRESVKRIHKISPEIQSIGIESFRGDGWQLLISQPQYALHVAFLLISALRMANQPDTRIAIGVGAIEGVPDQSLAEANGEAFRLSGKRLDEMAKNRILECCFSNEFNLINFEGLINSSLYLASHIATGWSEKRARAIWGAIQGLTQIKIGQLWSTPIQQQSVQETLIKSGWPEIEALMHSFMTLCVSWLK